MNGTELLLLCVVLFLQGVFGAVVWKRLSDLRAKVVAESNSTNSRFRDLYDVVALRQDMESIRRDVRSYASGEVKEAVRRSTLAGHQDRLEKIERLLKDLREDVATLGQTRNKLLSAVPSIRLVLDKLEGKL